MKNGIDRKRSTLIILIIMVLVGILFSIKSLSTGNKNSTVDPGKYSAYVVLETKTADETSNKHIISFKDDGNSIVANSDYLKGLLYILDDSIYTFNGGRYQKTTGRLSYSDLYRVLYNLEFSKEDGNYNPKFDKDIANDILDCLLIDSYVEKDVYSNVSVKDGKLKKFSVYLANIKNFKELNISVVFDYLDEDFENALPIFYKEVTDEMDVSKILINN